MEIEKFFALTHNLYEIKNEMLEFPQSRQLSLAVTKLEEAQLWFQEILKDFMSDKPENSEKLIKYFQDMQKSFETKVTEKVKKVKNVSKVKKAKKG